MDSLRNASRRSFLSCFLSCLAFSRLEDDAVLLTRECQTRSPPVGQQAMTQEDTSESILGHGKVRCLVTDIEMLRCFQVVAVMMRM
jgi:hypothetical protein